MSKHDYPVEGKKRGREGGGEAAAIPHRIEEREEWTTRRGEESTIQQQSGGETTTPEEWTKTGHSMGRLEGMMRSRYEIIGQNGRLRRMREDGGIKKPPCDSLSRSVFLSALLSHLLRYAFSEIRRPLGGSLKIVEREATGGGKREGLRDGEEGRGGEGKRMRRRRGKTTGMASESLKNGRRDLIPNGRTAVEKKSKEKCDCFFNCFNLINSYSATERAPINDESDDDKMEKETTLEQPSEDLWEDRGTRIQKILREE